MRRYLLMVPIFLMTLSGCDDDNVRPEVIDKLRAIGVERTPSVTTSSLVGGPATSDLVAYVALPAGQTIDGLEPFVDEGNAYALPSTVTTDIANITYQQVGPLRLATIPAVMTLPPVTEDQLAAFNGVARARFGLKVTVGEEVEQLVGDVLIVSPDNEVLTAEDPSAQIVEPGLDSTRGSSGPLTGSITKTFDEAIKVVWFVSSGEITNQFAIETEWTGAEAGEQAVILGLFPRKTRAFSIQYGTVTVE